MATTDYLKTIEDVRSTVLEYASKQWSVLKKSHGVEVSCHQFPDVPVKIYKAVGELDAPPSTTLEYALPGPCRTKWDKTVKTWEVLEHLDEKTFIVHSITHSGALGLIAPRDYIDLVRVEKDFDGGLYFSSSVGIDYQLPEDPKLVRGWNYPSGMLCYPLEGGRTRMVYLVHTDLKGMLPLKLIETTLPSIQFSFFTNLRKAIKQNIKDK